MARRARPLRPSLSGTLTRLVHDHGYILRYVPRSLSISAGRPDVSLDMPSAKACAAPFVLVTIMSDRLRLPFRDGDGGTSRRGAAVVGEQRERAALAIAFRLGGSSNPLPLPIERRAATGSGSASHAKAAPRAERRCSARCRSAEAPRLRPLQGLQRDRSGFRERRSSVSAVRSENLAIRVPVFRTRSRPGPGRPRRAAAVEIRPPIVVRRGTRFSVVVGPFEETGLVRGRKRKE